MTERIRFCYVCKQEISRERREAQPDTELCTTHGQEIEQKYGGEFVRWSEPIRTDKGGIKTNIGGYQPGKRRNQEGMDSLRDEYRQQSSNEHR